MTDELTREEHKAVVDRLKECKVELKGILDEIQELHKQSKFAVRRADQEFADVVIKAVAGYYNVPVDGVRSQTRLRPCSLSRQIAAYILRKHNGATFQQIGALISDKPKNHAAVLHGVNGVKDALYLKEKTGKDPIGIAQAVEYIEAYLFNEDEHKI